MSIVQAMRVRLVGQHLDDVAFRHAPAAAHGDHARELRLQRPQASDAAAHRGQVLAGDRIHLGAGALRIVCQRQQRPHILQRKAQFARVADYCATIWMRFSP